MWEQLLSLIRRIVRWDTPQVPTVTTVPLNGLSTWPCPNCGETKRTVQPEHNNVTSDDLVFMRPDATSFTSYAEFCAHCGGRICAATKADYDAYLASREK